ncbi:unnamed protein product [Acanthosepion pharaonis]|uniref:Fibrinogen C-terminal domain-containing protein n=1 Tax=Acanthosepion pharaonis TaxID=158019 RepID=A0A812B166_ACAPH|nr:unnamed protein product [Sepia pharaonis]
MPPLFTYIYLPSFLSSLRFFISFFSLCFSISFSSFFSFSLFLISFSFLFFHFSIFFLHCDDIHQNGGAGENGVYLIKPDYAPHPFRVECEFESDKAWTLIQKRSNGEVDFYRGWNDYKNGFGTVGGEFWLGNEKIYYLSVQATYELQINMWDWEDVTRGTSTQTGNYYQGGSSFFFVEDEKNYYKLRVPEVRRQTSIIFLYFLSLNKTS